MSKAREYFKEKETESFSLSECLVGIACFLFIIYFLSTKWDFLGDTIQKLTYRPDPNSIAQLDANHSFDSTRMGYEVGNARTLTEDAHIVLFFVDDQEGQWTADEAQQFTQDNVLPGLEFIKQNAASYGYDIELPVTTYFASVDGVIDDHMTESDGKRIPSNPEVHPLYNFSVVVYMANHLGYENNGEMLEAHRKEWNANQIAYIIIPKKAGWSYAISKHSETANNGLEFCYVYWQDMHGEPNQAAAVSHELLHLFGAEDLYLSGSKNVERSALAQQLHPDEIMLQTKYDLSQNIIGDFTAYTVGWIDALPSAYDCDAWWN